MKEKREYHPYGNFLPRNTRYLLIGSFPISKFTDPKKKDQIKTHEIDFFFGGERNLLWKILSRIFDVELKNKKAIKAFLINHQLGIVDLIVSCRRKNNGASDSSLFDIEWNTQVVKIIQSRSIELLIFTSKSVETWFKKLYPTLKVPTMTLVSPSSQTQRSLGSNQDYLRWKHRHPTRKPIEFIELSYRRKLIKLLA